MPILILNKSGKNDYKDNFFTDKNKNQFKFAKEDREFIKRIATFVQRNGEKIANDILCSQLTISTEKDETITFAKKNTHTHQLLYKLIEIADQNEGRIKNGYRFDPEIASAAAALRVLTGPSVYNMIQSRMNLALPSLSSTNRRITDGKYKMIEGHLEANRLSQYLDQHKLPRIVSLSEDATRIVARIQYDPYVNEVVGFVLPLDNKTGLPIAHTFPADTAEQIWNHFNASNEPSHHANVIMAQPLSKIAPFCLLLFGTNGKYTAEDIANRWKNIQLELNKANIEVLTISTDSDQKQNSAMRKCSQLGVRSSIFDGYDTDVDWFGMNADLTRNPFYVQDTVHVGTKLRNFLLRTWKNLNKIPFGKYYIRVQHLKFLVDHLSKDQHQLTDTVLNPIDKQNFQSVLRLCDENVINLLKLHVPNSIATIKFLEITHNIIESYMNPGLSPLERIYKIWYAVFVLRIWRHSIKLNQSLSLEESFLTLNCYSCIEINAHSLVLIGLNLKERKMDQLFLPHLFESQPCESFFRKIRSMTGAYSTVTNCSIKEMLGRINRIRFLDESALNSEIGFPRIKKTQTYMNRNEHTLPMLKDVYNTIERARSEALDFALEIGLFNKNNVRHIPMACPIRPLRFKVKPTEQTNEAIEEDEMFLRSRSELEFESLLLPNYSDKFIEKDVPESSQYAKVFLSNGTRSIVKKGALCWLLRPNPNKLSSDRLHRVQAKTSVNQKTKLKTKIAKKFKTTKIISKKPKRVMHVRKRKY